MPTNRFGEVNAAPIYNATGRNSRMQADIDAPASQPAATPFRAPAAGVSKDFGADPNMQPKDGWIKSNLIGWNPLNPLSRFGQRMAWGGGGGGGGGGQSSGYNQEQLEQIGKSAFAGQTIIQKGHGDMTGNTIGVNVGGSSSGNIGGFNPSNQTISSNNAGGAPTTSATRAPRATRNPAQKAARNERDRNRRAEQRAAGVAPKPRAGKKPPKASAPARGATTPQPAAKSYSGDVVNKMTQTSGGNF